MLRNSSARVVYCPAARKEYRVKSAKSRIEFAGPVGVGAHERGDGVQRVVDEVRADLRPQRKHLGSVEPRAGSVQLRQFDLARRVAGHLADCAHQPRTRRACRHHHEHADHTGVVGEQRLRDHRRLTAASAPVADRKSTLGPRVRMRRRPPVPRSDRRADRAPATRRHRRTRPPPRRRSVRADAERPRAPNPVRGPSRSARAASDAV